MLGVSRPIYNLLRAESPILTRNRKTIRAISQSACLIKYVRKYDNHPSNFYKKRMYYSEIIPNLLPLAVSVEHVNTAWIRCEDWRHDLGGLAMTHLGRLTGRNACLVQFGSRGSRGSPRPRVSPPRLNQGSATHPNALLIFQYFRILPISSQCGVDTWRRLNADGNPLKLNQFPRNPGHRAPSRRSYVLNLWPRVTLTPMLPGP